MSTHYEYRPKGVCSRKMIFEINGDIIESLTVEGGCKGNLKGIGALVKGKKLDDVIEALEGIRCGIKSTSCPDQIAKALKQYTEQ
ncbi:MAG: TIGR03905 family TSCPD domain-containing protein [Erysipelotrichaceae bacterium]|nr:TIGR03905 family TSCPD domain-containing protein [Erysipelotrichaceae bacterium]